MLGNVGAKPRFFGGLATTNGNDRWEEYGFLTEKKTSKKLKTKYRG